MVTRDSLKLGREAKREPQIAAARSLTAQTKPPEAYLMRRTDASSLPRSRQLGDPGLA